MANFLQQILGTRPASDPSEFGYPAGASVYVLKNELGQFHLIYGAVADTQTSAGLNALYANAPNGSIYVFMAVAAGMPRIAIKFGNIGLATGSFLFSNADYATLT